MNLSKSLANFHNKTLPYFQLLIVVYVILLTVPNLIWTFHGNLDPSWVIGLHKAQAQKLIYGVDVIFTHGPLGFLTYPVFISKKLWLYSAAYTIMAYVLTLCSFSLYVKKTKANLINTALSAVIFIAAFSTDWIPVIYDGPPPTSAWVLSIPVFVFSYLYVLGKKQPLLLIPLAFLYSILPFIKFSYAPVIFISAAILLFILVRNKRRSEALIFLTSGFITFILLSLLLLGSFRATAMYLYNSLQIASGYNDAMGTSSNVHQLSFAVFLWLAYISLLIHDILRKKRSAVIYLILCFSLLFVSFKQAFVRNDLPHVLNFYLIWMLVAVMYYLKFFYETKIIRYIVLLLTVSMLVRYLVIFDLPRGYYAAAYIPAKMNNLQLSYNILKSTDAEQYKEETKTYFRKYYNLEKEVIEMLSGHTVDVFPWDVAITEAYDFKWNPRPVFQSYSAYTTDLDSINANHFSSDSAPDFILYATQSIDDRYPFFDEPATFRMLLQKYELYFQEKQFLVLRKKHTAESTTEEYLHKTPAKFEQIIPLPEIENQLLFAKIRVEYNLLGHLSKLFFKPPKLYFRFFRNRQIAAYRFVFSNAENGVLVSPYIPDYITLANVWQGNIEKNVTGIAIGTLHPIFFKNDITVEFFKVVRKQ